MVTIETFTQSRCTDEERGGENECPSVLVLTESDTKIIRMIYNLWARSQINATIVKVVRKPSSIPIRFFFSSSL